MTEKAFRLDFFIAIAALLVSVLTSLILLYQTRVISQQYSATIWPYLTIKTTFSPRGEQVEVLNDGLGPALIQSAQLSADGRQLASWNDYFALLIKEAPLRAYFVNMQRATAAGKSINGSITTADLEPSDTIRPGEETTIFRVDLPNLPLASVEAHPLAFEVCYCSLNQSCWILHTTQGGKQPTTTQPVSHCAGASAIFSPQTMSLSAPRHKKSP